MLLFYLLLHLFRQILDVKVKEEVFVESDTSKLMDDTDFDTQALLSESESWLAFRKVTKGLLGNHKRPM